MNVPVSVTSAALRVQSLCQANLSNVDVQSEQVCVLNMNNNGVSLLQQNRIAEAANTFLQAVWQVEAMTGQKNTPGHLHHRHAKPMDNSPDSTEERAKPSCYIFQREDYDEGLQVYKQCFKMTPGGTLSLDEQVVILRYNMGQVYLRYKYYNQARRWFQTAWIHAQHLTSKSCQLSLPILHNLAYSYYCLGDNKSALSCYQDALALTVDPQSKERADAYNCIAVLLFHNSSAQENNTAKALELLKEGLSIYQRHGLFESPQVATCLGNVGRIHFLTSAHEQALKAFHKAYAIRKQIFGTESMDTAAMLFNLGQSLHFRGVLDQALEAYREFLRMARIHFNTNAHRDICAVQRAMAQVHRQKGQMKEACILLRQAYQAGCDALGPIESEVSCILSELGSLYAETDDYPNAIDCFQRFLKAQEKLHDPLHNNILITKINLARVYKHSADYTTAFTYYKEVHAMQVQLLARGTGSQLDVASTLSSMGLMLYLLHAYNPALDCYQEALRVRLDKLGTSQHTDVAETINSIGLVLFKLGMMEMAKEAFRECIELRTKLLEKNAEQQQDSHTSSSSSKEIAVLLFNMATACLQNGEEEQGMEWYNESLRVEREVLGDNHPDVCVTLQHIARVHEERGDFEEAIKYHRQALDIAQRGDQELVIRLLRTIGNLYCMEGHVDKGMTYFIDAARGEVSAHPEKRIPEGISSTGANFYGFSRLHPPGAPAA